MHILKFIFAQFMEFPVLLGCGSAHYVFSAPPPSQICRAIVHDSACMLGDAWPSFKSSPHLASYPGLPRIRKSVSYLRVWGRPGYEATPHSAHGRQKQKTGGARECPESL